MVLTGLYYKTDLVSGSKQYSTSIAFTLALFSHLVNHVNIRLQAELEQGESDVPPLRTDPAGIEIKHVLIQMFKIQMFKINF